MLARVKYGIGNFAYPEIRHAALRFGWKDAYNGGHPMIEAFHDHTFLPDR